MSDARQVIDTLLARGLSVACGESITGGLVCAQLSAVPGSSAALRGGVVAYQTDVKEHLLAVGPQVLAGGLVSEGVAVALAAGAAATLGSDVGIGTTGAAGPTPHDGAPPGNAWIAVSLSGVEPLTEQLQISGDRDLVRDQVAAAAITLALRALRALEA